MYVVDADLHLIDDIRIRQVLLAEPEKTVESLMDRQFVALKVTDDKRNAVDMFVVMTARPCLWSTATAFWRDGDDR